MKECYAIKFGDEYIANENVPIRISTGYHKVLTVYTEPCIEDAKHYKSIGAANSWITSNKKRMRKYVSDIELYRKKAEKSADEYKNSPSLSAYQQNNRQYYVQRYKDKAEGYARLKEEVKELLVKLDGLEVVKLENENPNFRGKFVLRWAKWVNAKYRIGGYKLERGIRANQYCPCCGVSLKNLTYIKTSGIGRVCGFCVERMHDAIKGEQEKLPSYIKDQYETDTFLRGV